jgi:hypothetical protein
LEGWSQKDTAAQLSIHPDTVKKYARLLFPNGVPKSDYGGEHAANKSDYSASPLAYSNLSAVAKDCLEDFARFRYRYFGRKSSPWQEDAAETVKEKLLTPFKEYGVINCPPGSGKTTLFTHDIPAWLTCRSRSIRGFLGHRTQTIANSYSGNLRQTFQRRVPVEAKSEDIALDLAVDAQATLPEDYGNFNPNVPHDIGAPWTRSSFTVAQLGGVSSAEKEATWTAFGRDTGFLGWRVNFAVWDDLQKMQNLRNIETIEEDRRWYISEAITRLEPGGLFLLQMQRLGAEDMSRYSLDMPSGYEDIVEEEWFELGTEMQPQGKKFFHVKYQAHYPEYCTADTEPQTHSIRARPYDPKHPTPGRCLLDPVRLSWRELKSIMAQPLSNFQVVYQQEDTDPTEVLVPMYWIEGGMHDGEEFLGCWDNDRDPGTIPSHIKGTPLSIMTVDPSPSKFWAIQWWLYVEPHNQDAVYDVFVDENGKSHRVRVYPGNRYLIDQLFTPMGANDLLDWNVDSDTWTGVLVEWHERSLKLGHPVRHLIIESNAAQKFMMQYSWFTKWCSKSSISMRPHHTHINKLDFEYGVKTIPNHYRYGRVRLPGTPEGRKIAEPLVAQVTRYPDATYDDCVMAHWFLEYQLQHLIKKQGKLGSVYRDIPSWLRQKLEQDKLFGKRDDVLGGV